MRGAPDAVSARAVELSAGRASTQARQARAGTDGASGGGIDLPEPRLAAGRIHPNPVAPSAVRLQVATGDPRIRRMVCPPGLFRLLLATCVLVSHATDLEIGRIAVLLFFVLSGYWIHDIWRARFDLHDLPIFYISRYLRIAPVYFVGLSLTIMISRSQPEYAHYLILNAANLNADPLWVSWSLDIELQFYILMPVLAFVLTHGAGVFLAATLVASLCGWLLYHATGIVEAMQYVPAFALGMLIRERHWDPGPARAVLALAAFAALTLALALCPDTAPYLLKDRPHPVNRDLFAFLWMLPLLPYVAHSLARPSGRFDRHLGNVSYSLYVMHPVVMTFLTIVAPHKSLLLKLGSLVSIFAAACAVYVLVDRPFERIRHRAERQLRAGLGRRITSAPGCDESALRRGGRRLGARMRVKTRA